MKPFYVYLLRCSDGSYYCGHTDDLDNRMLQHERSSVGYTATRKPVTLVWKGEFERRDEAISMERQIKGWSRAKKEALIAGDWNKVSELARCRQTPFDRLRANGGDRLRANGGDGLRANGGDGLAAIDLASKYPLSVRAELVEAQGPSTSSGRTGVSKLKGRVDNAGDAE